MHTKFLRIGVLPVLLGTLLVTILLSEVSFGLLVQEKPDNQEGTRLYFAYGSNLDEEQMAQRCLTRARKVLLLFMGIGSLLTPEELLLWWKALEIM